MYSSSLLLRFNLRLMAQHTGLSFGCYGGRLLSKIQAKEALKAIAEKL